MKNEYEVRGDVTAIFLNSQKYGKMETLISTSKLEKAKEFPYAWYPIYNKSTNSFYVRGNQSSSSENRKNTSLHRWIKDAYGDIKVDHKDHDTLNNTDKNLRIVTNYQNSQNRKGPNSNNKSGIRGVHWHKKDKRWRVKVCVDGKNPITISFKTIEEAKRAAEDARNKYMPFSQEGIAN